MRRAHDRSARWLRSMGLPIDWILPPMTTCPRLLLRDRRGVRHRQVAFAEAGALTPQGLAAVQQRMRARVLR
jgi:hypothetical protein